MRPGAKKGNRLAPKRAAACGFAVVAALALTMGLSSHSDDAWSQAPPWQTTVVALPPSPSPPPPGGLVFRDQAPFNPLPPLIVEGKPDAATFAAPLPFVPAKKAQIAPLPPAPVRSPSVTRRLAPLPPAPTITGALPAPAPEAAPIVIKPKAEAPPHVPTVAPTPIRLPTVPADPEGELARQYCATVGDIASRARAESERRTIVDMTEQLDKRISQLEQKIAEHKEWLAKREQFLATAQESLVRIYSGMKTEAAASQLAAMPEAPAAAIVAKMQPKMAGSILADMDPARAARLTSIMAGAAEMGATAESAERGGPPR